MKFFSHKKTQKDAKKEDVLFVISRVFCGNSSANNFPTLGKIKPLMARMAQIFCRCASFWNTKKHFPPEDTGLRSNAWKKEACVARTFLSAHSGRQECLPHSFKVERAFRSFVSKRDACSTLMKSTLGGVETC